MDLQNTLSASTRPFETPAAVPHHPITCFGPLRYHPDGSFSCPHASVPPGDVRTQLCLDHSVALLLIELASHL